MDKQIHIPGQKPKLAVGVLAAAQEFQKALDALPDIPEWYDEMLNNSLDILGTSEELLGGKQVYLHTHDSYRINPFETKHVPNLDRDEEKYGEMIIKAYFNGIAHFETMGRIALNELCLDLSNVKVIKDYDMGLFAPDEQIPGSFLVPVKSVESVLAAA
jgi:hypothetical protein